MSGILNPLKQKEVGELIEYLDWRIVTPELVQLIQHRMKEVGTVYRGLWYRKENIKVGHIYEPESNLSSWSMDEIIGTDFACSSILPEKQIEAIYEEQYGEFHDYHEIAPDIRNELFEEFCPIVLVDKDGFGFNVNDFYLDHQFVHEKEIIAFVGKWEFVSIEKSVYQDDIPYDKVYVKRIRD